MLHCIFVGVVSVVVVVVDVFTNDTIINRGDEHAPSVERCPTYSLVILLETKTLYKTNYTRRYC